MYWVCGLNPNHDIWPEVHYINPQCAGLSQGAAGLWRHLPVWRSVLQTSLSNTALIKSSQKQFVWFVVSAQWVTTSDSYHSLVQTHFHTI